MDSADNLVGSPLGPFFPPKFSISQANIQTLFGKSGFYEMVPGDRIRVVERFRVTGCSTLNDAPTTCKIAWNECGGPNTCVGGDCESTRTLIRHTEVSVASGGFTPSVAFQDPNTHNPVDLAFCTGTPSDIVVSFTNSGPDVSETAPGYPCGDNGAPGSARKKLDRMFFPFKANVFGSPTVGGAFPLSFIRLEGTLPNGSTNSVALPPGFYTYVRDTARAAGTIPPTTTIR